MFRLWRFPQLAGLLAGLALGCSPGSDAPPGASSAKHIQGNPRNPKKFIQAEPEGPPAPPLKR